MTRGKVLAYATLGAVLLAITYGSRTELATWIKEAENQISHLGVWGPVAFLGLYVVSTFCFFPDSVISAAAGALFGALVGAATCFAGALIVQSAVFVISRHFLRARVLHAIERRPKLAIIPRVVDRQGLRLQTLLRLTPINPVLLSYVLGTTNSPFRTFWLACFALAPAIFVQAYCGYTARHMIKAAGLPHEHSWLETAVVAGGLIACLLFLFTMIRIARQAVAEAERQINGNSADLAKTP